MTRAGHRILLAVLALALTSCSDDSPLVVNRTQPPARPCPAFSDYLHTIGLYNTPGESTDLSVIGNYAYVADGDNGLVTIDVSDPRAPVVTSVLDLRDATKVAAAGKLAFVATGYRGLAVVSLDDPATPATIKSINTAGTVSDIAFQDDLIYVADDAAGLMIFDVTDPAAPVARGIENTPGSVSGVEIYGQVALVTDVNTGIRIISVQDPDVPWEVTALALPGRASDVCVANNFAYVTAGNAGLHVIDISDIVEPRLVTTVDTPGEAVAVVTHGDYAFVADRWEGLQVITIADPAEARLVSSSDTEATTWELTFVGNVVFCAEYEGGLRIIDATNPESVPVSDVFPVTSSARATAFDGEHVYVADDAGNIHVTLPTRLGLASVGDPVQLSGSPVAVVWYGGYLYAALGSDPAVIVDVYAPTGPTVVGDIPGSAGTVQLAVADSVVYMARGLTTPTGYDLKGDRLVAYDAGGAFVPGVSVGEDYLYFAEGLGRISVFNRDPGLSTRRLSFASTTGRARDVLATDDFVFVAVSPGKPDEVTGEVSSAGVDVFDISNPVFPAHVKLLETSVGARHLTLDSDLLYVAGRGDGLEILDVTDPLNPVRVGTFSPDDDVYDVLPLGKAVHVAAGRSGVLTLSLLCENVKYSFAP